MTIENTKQGWAEVERKAREFEVKQRLEYLRNELRAECISYGELAELMALVPYIDPNDVELLEAAGVPESHP